jgi:hypothetical protein
MARQVTMGSLILCGIGVFSADLVCGIMIVSVQPSIGFNVQTAQPALLLLGSWAGFWLVWRHWRRRDAPVVLSEFETSPGVGPPPIRWPDE